MTRDYRTEIGTLFGVIGPPRTKLPAEAPGWWKGDEDATKSGIAALLWRVENGLQELVWEYVVTVRCPNPKCRGRAVGTFHKLKGMDADSFWRPNACADAGQPCRFRRPPRGKVKQAIDRVRSLEERPGEPWSGRHTAVTATDIADHEMRYT